VDGSRPALFTAARMPTENVLPPRPPNETLSVDRTTIYYAKKPRKKCKFRDDLFYSHGPPPVDDNKTAICRICLTFGRVIF
jgi:hypothetical protein